MSVMGRLAFAKATSSLVAFSAIAIAYSSSARADETNACIASAEAAQQLRRHGQLVEAESELVTCSRTECPAIVRSDCAKWLDEVRTSTPTIVVRALNASGDSVIDFRVAVDGVVREKDYSGAPLRVDPGARELRFDAEGFAPIVEKVTIDPSDRHRPISLVFTSVVAPPRVAHDEAARPATVVASDERASVPRVTWVLGGTAIVATIGFAAFGMWGRSEANDLRSTCAPRCAESTLDAPRTKFILADVSLGVAGLAAAGALLGVVLAPKHPSAPSVGLIAAPSGAVFGIRGNLD